MPLNVKPSGHPGARQEPGRHQLLSMEKAVKFVDCDILIIGAGAAGLAAAAAVQDKEVKVIVVEKEKHVGGTTFKSGGCMWMPNNFLMQEQGIEDSKVQGKQYVNATERTRSKTHHEDAAGDSYSLRDRRLDAFLTRGPKMIEYFRDQGFRWMATPSKFPDYRPDVEGVVDHGRTIDPVVFDAASLGGWQKYLPAPDGAPLIPRFEDLRALTRPPLSGSRYGRLSALPTGMSRPVSMGRSLVAQLLWICQAHGNVDIWTSHELHSLLPFNGDDSEVAGARVCYRRGNDNEDKDDSNYFIDIRASQGVVLTTGGFSKNQDMRNTYVGTETLRSETAWSLAADGDNGIALHVGRSAGASTAQLDQVWGIPTLEDPRTGKVTEAMFAIAKPFSIIVDGTGHRFLSESKPYGDVVAAMYDRARQGAGAAVFWLVFDQSYIQRYPIGSLRPIHTRTVVLDGVVNRGRILRSTTLDDLAEQMQIPGDDLRATVDN
ncbi:3-oxosteroid 1-dehydrogenase [Fusarium heterosporum]|uniref:3-oxosteroid 1-dehydrogenase n=1 Tax=Fusarium heterosporum TaxID=42747 RepID=A0A8H5T1S3_FUSHE|nr:3-oxosteroid 1-dehydrogenase [Fusarium heterosporum]